MIKLSTKVYYYLKGKNIIVAEAWTRKHRFHSEVIPREEEDRRYRDV
jgi:hypothetical protein